ncbi:MAG: hypothetical protein QOJ35_2334 [Solirubrobacteraceae bacterium]|nr:hypothetical protein [Solirubrobacteraceae bacterium]
MSHGELPRVLAHARGRSLAEHRARFGAPEEMPHRRAALVEAIAAAGLRGRGGGAFPTATKLRAVAAGRGRRALVVNAAEGEPMSAKDRVLLELAPNLVLDGALLAAEAVGAREIVIAVKHSARGARETVTRLLGERRDTGGVRVAGVPDAYVAGEETALLHYLNGGPAVPTLVPPRPHQHGLGRRPTLVCNAETLAHLALVARNGAAWFRELGTPEHPGTALVTVAGAVRRPGVHEVALGTPIAQAIAGAGGASGPLRAVLVGGYNGCWLTPEVAAGTGLDNASLRARGGAVGAGVVFALPAGACPVAEVAGVVRWMARESAGQCGPCVHGLDAIAGALASIAAGRARPDVLDRLRRWAGQVQGRGACRHPDGVAVFVRSALATFADELEAHRRHGPCRRCALRPLLAGPDASARPAA